jgi:hypothetical protein
VAHAGDYLYIHARRAARRGQPQRHTGPFRGSADRSTRAGERGDAARP